MPIPDGSRAATYEGVDRRASVNRRTEIDRAFHRLTWLGADLPPGTGRCFDCRRVVTMEQWARERCPEGK